jgi:hypothetical protein
MARVTRPGGTVAACVWDFGGGRGPLSVFWQAVRDLDPSQRGESDLAGVREGDMERLFRSAGIGGVHSGVLTVSVRYATFEEWWEPYTFGVGPAGAYAASLTEDRTCQLRERCRDLLPPAPFDVTAAAWAAAGPCSRRVRC